MGSARPNKGMEQTNGAPPILRRRSLLIPSVRPTYRREEPNRGHDG
jgi:hypothetical protein